MGKVQVDLDKQIVTISYDPARANPEDIAKALEVGGDTVLPVGEVP